MSLLSRNRRPTLKVNPVEVIALLLVGGVFVNSMYRLVKEKDAVTLAVMGPTPSAVDRAVASAKLKPVVTATSAELKVCENEQEFLVAGANVRISGMVCFGDEVLITDLDSGRAFQGVVTSDGRFISEHVPNNRSYQIVFRTSNAALRGGDRSPAASFDTAGTAQGMRAQSSLTIRLRSNLKN